MPGAGVGLGVSRQPWVTQGWGMCNWTPLLWPAQSSHSTRSLPGIQWSPFRMSTLVSPLLTGAAPVAHCRPEMALKAFLVLFPNVWCKRTRHWAWVASWSGTHTPIPTPELVTGMEAADVFVVKDTIRPAISAGGSLLAAVCSSRQSSWPLFPSSLTARGYCHLGFARFICPAV